MTVLTGNEVIDDGIINDMINEDVQKQSCGVDLTIKKIEKFLNNGIVDFDNSTRKLPELQIVNPKNSAIQKGEDKVGGYLLSPGCYLVSFNETLDIPKDRVGIARPRSTMLRCGCTVETAVFDAGYIGKPQCLLVVHNPHGLVLGMNAKVIQIIFMEMNDEVSGYSGQYLYENIDTDQSAYGN